ncbi:class I SAM-dependent methyltransferase [Streptomyces sp. NPDC021224]|uniref:class I SAM-dependent methyltransferase n=1 Tax=unclassified Streptomyces TaxID=2593676 RepID=UPI0037903C8B
MPARHDIGAERRLWDDFAGSTREKALRGEPVFCWTQYGGHGPGPELLGSPGSALELGFGTGRALGHLLGQGVKVTGVDLSPVAVEAVRGRWEERGARLVCAEVLDFLAEATETYDAVYSIFGAVWFTDPARLFPLVRRVLAPGGVLAFSQPPAIPGAYGPQGMYKGGFAGPAQFTYRYSYTPRKWTSLLRNAGFTDVGVRVLDAPTPGHIGTLIGRAVAQG